MRRTAIRLWWRWFPLGRPLAWLQLMSDRRRFFAAIAGIGFAVIMMMFQLGLHEALLNGAVVVHRHLRADLVMLSGQYDFVAVNQPFTERRLQQARALAEVESVAVLHTRQALWRHPLTGKLQQMMVLGLRVGEAPLALPELERSGAVLQRLGSVLFDRVSRPQYGPVAELLANGGAFETEVNQRRVRVEGLFALGTTLAVDANLAMSEQTFQGLFPDTPPGLINVGLIRLREGADAKAVRDVLRERLLPDVQILTRDDYGQLEKNYWTKRTPLGFAIGASMVVGLIVGAVIVYQILYTDVTEHLPEYATLKAMGYDDGFFIRLVLGQALVLTLGGYVPGVLVSAVLYRLMGLATNIAPHLTIGNLLIVLLLTAGMCAAAGMLATRRLRHARPAEIF